MTELDVINIVQLLEKNNIEVYIDGGWGIDALIGKQTRQHADLDIAIQHKDVLKLRKLLSNYRYQEIKRSDTKEYNFVLQNNDGNLIDVHSYTFDSKGNNIYGVAYPKASLKGIGTIDGHPVNCISLKWVIKFHEQYQPDADDIKDIKALCNAYKIKPPNNYINLL